jgi:Mrp family chromosome partitioning ATPase
MSSSNSRSGLAKVLTAVSVFESVSTRISGIILNTSLFDSSKV